MNPIFQTIFTRFALSDKKGKVDEDSIIREIDLMKLRLIQFFKEFVLITAGFLLAGFGFLQFTRVRNPDLQSEILF